MAKVIVFGNGAIAQLVYYEFVYDSDNEVCAFTVDRDFCTGDTLLGKPLIPFDEISSAYPAADYDMFVATGYVKLNRLREERCAQAKALGYRLISHISSRAVIRGEIEVSENTFVSPNVVISPSARIGTNVFLGGGSVVAHDCVVGDHCFFSNGVTLAGGAKVGPYCYIGPNATIRNHVTIGRESVIGAGALILADTDEKSVYLGHAAERLPIASDTLNLA